MKSYLPVLLEEIFGDSRKHAEHRGQISFDCPECDDGKHKGNLEVNYEMGVFKCWSCRDTNQMYGSLYNLIKSYGTENNLETYRLLKPNSDYFGAKKVIDTRELELPKELYPLHNDNSEPAIRIKQYLYGRGFNDNLINRFKLQFSTTKGFKGRVIIPTFDIDNKIEYYVGRSIYDFLKPKYNNADLDKELIIMFEQMINWEADIYIVEGVMDAMVLPNAIPILGKYITSKLLKTLRTKAKANIIVCLDGDAQDDANKLYDDLNILELQGRIRIIKLVGDWDLSKIYEKLGLKGILKIIKTANKKTET